MANGGSRTIERRAKKIGSVPHYYVLCVRVRVYDISVYVLYVRYKKYSYLTAPLALAVQNSLPTFYGTMVVGFSSSEELTAGTFNEAKLNTDSIEHCYLQLRNFASYRASG